MAAKVSDNRRRLNYSARGRLGVFAVAVVLGVAACGQVVACQVEEVDMYVGRTESEARSEYYGTWTGEDCTFWVYLEWTAVDQGDANDQDFEIKIQNDVGANWSTVHTETGDHVKDKVDENCSIVCDFAKSFEVDVNGVLDVGINLLRATVQRLETSDVVPCDQNCWVHVVEVEMFRDSLYTKKVRDWPAEGSKARDPKYLFSKNDPIYVQVQGLGQDLTQETSPDAVEVTSTNGGPLYLDLKETSGGSQVFRNSLADHGELLFLSDETQDTEERDEIRVFDEEVLRFQLRCPLIGSRESYEDSNDVMVDRAEVGVEWQVEYATYSGEDDLPNSDDRAKGFKDNIGTAGQIWFENFDNGDLNSEKDHWDSVGDSCYADDVDFAWWSGHGEMQMKFFIGLVGGEKQDPEVLNWGDIDWGDEDVDWVVSTACSFLNSSDATLAVMADGVHLICGWANTAYDKKDGQTFAQELETTSIINAWKNTCRDHQPSGVTARVFGSSDCEDDSIGTTGPIFVSRDPTGNWTHWDYTKP